MHVYLYVHLLRRSWRLLVASTVAVLALSALITVTTTPVYEGRVQLFVTTTGGTNASTLAAGSLYVQDQVATYASVVSSPLVLQPVIDELAIDESPAELRRRVNVHVPPGTALINVKVSHSDPYAAATWANSIGERFTDAVQVLDKVDEFSVSPVRATVVRRAVPSDLPANPRPVRTMALGGVLGILLGLGLAARKDRIGTRINTEEDVNQVSSGTPVLGRIPYDADVLDGGLLVHAMPHGAGAEAYRTLRTNLRFLGAAHPPRSVVVTSCEVNEGKTTTAANLALAMAEAGSRVCLVDGDLRRPKLLRLLGLEDTVGITDVLVGAVGLQDALQPVRESLLVLGAGSRPPNPSELIGSEEMGLLMRRLEAQFDYVLVDSPALLSVTDASVLCRLTSGALVVVWAGVTRKEQLSRGLSALERAGATTLGIVLNQVPRSSAGPDDYHHAYTSAVLPVPG